MELYSVATPEEKKLRIIADQKHIPLGGTLELLPMCNMDCRMCYVHLTKAEMEASGRMLSAKEWIEIIDQAISQGLLFLLLTGGEPLLYPEFKTIYREFSKRGLILTVNTNGSLLDEETAKMFRDYGCRRMNITLYGKDNETYTDLCRNPHGFDQVIHAFELMKKYDIPFRMNCSVTPYNVSQLPEFHRIAKEFGVPMTTATYMFPAMRRGKSSDEQERLSPEDAGRATVTNFKLMNPKADFDIAVKGTLAQMKLPPRYADSDTGSACHAGRSGFWMNWKGELTPCGMFNEPCISMLQHGFTESWKYIVTETAKMRRSPECIKCPKQNLCRICLASACAETGRTDGTPEYVCHMTNATYDAMMEYLASELQN